MKLSEPNENYNSIENFASFSKSMYNFESNSVIPSLEQIATRSTKHKNAHILFSSYKGERALDGNIKKAWTSHSDNNYPGLNIELTSQIIIYKVLVNSGVCHT